MSGKVVWLGADGVPREYDGAAVRTMSGLRHFADLPEGFEPLEMRTFRDKLLVMGKDGRLLCFNPDGTMEEMPE